MRDEEEKLNFGAWVLGVFVALVLYVLSVGPMAALVAPKGGVVYQRFMIVYAPIIWLHLKTPLKGPIEAYVRLWESWCR